MRDFGKAVIGAVIGGIVGGLVVTSAWDAQTASPAQRRSALLEMQLRLWEDRTEGVEEQEQMRAINAEWDFMARTFLVLSLTNLALDDPSQSERYLSVVDRIIADTLALEKEHGQWHFLMDYSRHRAFRSASKRSVFVDGEIAVMLGARRLVTESAPWRHEMNRRVSLVAAEIDGAPQQLVESYPNEGWLFCNTFALVALRMEEVLDRRDHSETIEAWLRSADEHLKDPSTGLLVSSFTVDGDQLDGPEGSSIWLSATNLLLIDEDLARDQYQRAKHELSDAFLGFAYAREWPSSWRGPLDVDSGPVIPMLDASPSSSGFAILASRAFGDTEYHRRLVAALDVADIALAPQSPLSEMADNAVAESVILYSLTFGPLWQRVRELDELAAIHQRPGTSLQRTAPAYTR